MPMTRGELCKYRALEMSPVEDPDENGYMFQYLDDCKPEHHKLTSIMLAFLFLEPG